MQRLGFLTLEELEQQRHKGGEDITPGKALKGFILALALLTSISKFLQEPTVLSSVVGGFVVCSFLSMWVAVAKRWFQFQWIMRYWLQWASLGSSLLASWQYKPDILVHFLLACAAYCWASISISLTYRAFKPGAAKSHVKIMFMIMLAFFGLASGVAIIRWDSLDAVPHIDDRPLTVESWSCLTNWTQFSLPHQKNGKCFFFH